MARTLLFILISALCCACHQGGTSSAQGADTIDVRLAVLPVADCEPFVVAQRLGLYDSLGVKVKVSVYQSAMDIDTAVLRRRANMFFTDTVRLARLLEQKKDIRIARQFPARFQLLTMDSTVIYLKNLAFKTVAMTRYSAENRLFDNLLHQANIPDGDCFPIQVNDIDLRLQMLLQGHVSAAFLPSPQAEQALAAGAHRLVCADSIEQFVFAYRPTKKLSATKLERVLRAYEMAKTGAPLK